MLHPRLVIVADDSIVRLDLRELLQALGYGVVGEAGDGPSAVTLARELRPNLVLMELRLSGPLDGLDVASALTREPGTPVLLLTTASDLERARRAAQVGVADYLVTPFDEDQLRPAIERALDRDPEFPARAREAGDLRATRGAHISGTGQGPGAEAPARQRAGGFPAHAGGKHERLPAAGPHGRSHPACRARTPGPSAGHPGPIGGMSWIQATQKRRIAKHGPFGY
jgi:DNA-binding NarL/FixJ family response regulator